MIVFDEGLTLCGRVTWGTNAGYIIQVTARTYRVRWLDGAETEQLRNAPYFEAARPDLDEEDAA